VAEDGSGLPTVVSLLGGVLNRGAKVRRWSWRETVQRTRTHFEHLLRTVGADGVDVVILGRLDLIAAVVVPLPRIYAVGHMLVGMPPCCLWVGDVDTGRACRACSRC
jgi:hypothetical protein